MEKCAEPISRVLGSTSWAISIPPWIDSLASPLAVRKDKVLYLAAPLFRGYKKFDYWAYRAMVHGLLSELLPDQLCIRRGQDGWNLRCSDSLVIRSTARDRLCMS